ncbi:hypothetical protein [Lysinibacillus sp. ZYM-1]|nr:hypothetical protein [Lysinibacillus sp. ZYM-1]
MTDSAAKVADRFRKVTDSAAKVADSPTKIADGRIILEVDGLG